MSMPLESFWLSAAALGLGLLWLLVSLVIIWRMGRQLGALKQLVGQLQTQTNALQSGSIGVGQRLIEIEQRLRDKPTKASYSAGLVTSEPSFSTDLIQPAPLPTVNSDPSERVIENADSVSLVAQEKSPVLVESPNSELPTQANPQEHSRDHGRSGKAYSKAEAELVAALQNGVNWTPK